MNNYIYLVKFDLDTPVYLTDGHRDFEYGGQTYRSGKVLVSNAVTQKSKPSASDFSLTLSAVDQTMISVFAGNAYKNRRCLIQKATLDENEQITNVSVWLDGDLSKYTFSGKLKEPTLKISVSSVFGAFESVNSMNLRLLFKDSINEDQTLYWGKDTPVSTTTDLDRESTELGN